MTLTLTLILLGQMGCRGRAHLSGGRSVDCNPGPPLTLTLILILTLTLILILILGLALTLIMALS